MKKLSIRIILLSILLSACESDFLDINTDPNSSTRVEPELLFARAINRLSLTKTIEVGAPSNFFSQTWVTGRSTGVFITSEAYTISGNTVGNSWFQYYVASIKNLRLAIDLAESSDPVNNNAAAQCKIVESLFFFYITSMWGDVPYTDAVNLDVAMPRFDSQEVVFQGLLARLDEAIAQIDVNSSFKIDAPSDLYYGGDMVKWRKFAKSLKFRILMMMADRTPTVSTQIAALLAEGDMISTQAENARYPFFDRPNGQNPYNKLLLNFSAGENVWFYAPRTLVDLMISLDDPRISKYFREGEAADPGEFVGIDPGVAATTVTSPVNETMIEADTPDQILSLSEQLLYEAEAIARGLAPGGLTAANTKYRAGVQASLEYYGVDAGAVTDYLNSLADLNTLTAAEAIETIQIQQYIGLFGRDVDVWNHWRRTEVIDLPLPAGATLGNLIRRFPYPATELTSNTNAPAQPTLDTKMWFDQ